MNEIKLSVVVPNYNNGKYLKETIDRLLNQTYKNIEIIVVDDGSSDGSDEIMGHYSDKKIKYVKHKINRGLFQTRLTGADIATGEYIGFLDADDYVSVDFYRELIEKCESGKYDIVVGNTVLNYEDGRCIVQPMRELDVGLIPEGKLLDEYFRQEGLDFSWHTLSTKIYSMNLWRKARRHYDKITTHLLMTEDFAFSTVLFYYAENIAKIENGALFYRQLASASTSPLNMSYDKCKKNISDLITSFNFVENFLKEKKVYNKYKVNFYNWKHLYANQHRYSINSASLSDNQKSELNQLLDEYCSNKEIIVDDNFFYSHSFLWDDRLENLKKAIIDPQIKVVSFDIFDTLIVRPFFKPTDLFKMLDNDYRKLRGNNAGISFSKMRPIAEAIAREEQYKKEPSIQEITLDQIYDSLGKIYNIDKKYLEAMKKREMECEIRFCTRRNTAYELYKLALYIGKKVICTSDMYLPEKTILDILNKNGYDKISKLYLSSSIGKTKSTGDLYRYVLDEEGIEASELIHIGDNYQSDYKMAESLHIRPFHFIKPIEVMTNCDYTNSLSKMLTSSLPFWQDNRSALDFLGIRTMLAVVANKYFDNPYRAFDKETDFNADPYLIGYYALGMYMFGVSNWLAKGVTGKYDKISFMARDGYLVMEAYKLIKQLYDNLPEEEYIYVSRKALMPIMISDTADFYKLSDLVAYDMQSPKRVIKYLDNILNIDTKKLKKLCGKENIIFDNNFTSLEDFNKFIKLLIEHFYDKKVHMKNRNKLKEYFDQLLGKRAAVFDVGYSARPEFYLSNLLNRNIDTFFLNINSDEALEYSKLGKFGINTFFPAKPTATGNAYEFLISKLAPSCISYDLSKDKVEPIFEEYKNTYQVEHIIEIMQKAVLSFINDLIDIFGKDIDLLYYQDYYISLPIMAYFNSTNEKDKLPLFAVSFEDEIRTGKVSRMVSSMQEDLKSKNQQLLYNLGHLPFTLGEGNLGLDYSYLVKFASHNTLEYNPIVDLNNHSKLMRLIFYLLFDRVTLKRRLDGVLYKIKRKLRKNAKK